MGVCAYRRANGQSPHVVIDASTLAPEKVTGGAQSSMQNPNGPAPYGMLRRQATIDLHQSRCAPHTHHVMAANVLYSIESCMPQQQCCNVVCSEAITSFCCYVCVHVQCLHATQQTACLCCSVPMTNNHCHVRRATTEFFSSPSTSEDESASGISNLVPLLPRAASRRHRRYTCFPSSLYGSPDTQQETGLMTDPEPVGVSNLTNQLQQQLLEQHMQSAQQAQHAQKGIQPQHAQQPQQACMSHQAAAGQQQERGAGGCAEGVHVVGLALLHPSLAGEVGPSFTRLLGRSR